MQGKIIQFIPSLNDGGAETLVKDYCIIGKKYGLNMKILTYMIFPDTANTNIIKNNGVEVIHIYSKWNIFTRCFHKVFGSFYIPLKIKRILKEEKPDILHVHMNLLSYIAPLSDFFNQHRIKLLYTCHSLPERYFKGDNKREFIACNRLIAKNKLQLIALHEEMRQELNNMFIIDNTIIIKNGVNFERFLNFRVTKAEKRKELKIPEDAYVIGHIGRFDALKNHTFLIGVFDELQKKNDRARLLLIGSGSLENEIRTQISQLGLGKKVTIISNRTDIPELLSAMDVFVFPSMFEGLSVTLVEAQVAGLYCVVSDNINNETYCSSRIVELSLESPIEEWVNAILQPCGNILNWRNIEEFDLNREISKLSEIYWQ